MKSLTKLIVLLKVHPDEIKFFAYFNFPVARQLILECPESIVIDRLLAEQFLTTNHALAIKTVLKPKSDLNPVPEERRIVEVDVELIAKLGLKPISICIDPPTDQSGLTG